MRKHANRDAEAGEAHNTDGSAPQLGQTPSQVGLPFWKSLEQLLDDEAGLHLPAGNDDFVAWFTSVAT